VGAREVVVEKVDGNKMERIKLAVSTLPCSSTLDHYKAICDTDFVCDEIEIERI
jgi:hypothetical protein